MSWVAYCISCYVHCLSYKSWRKTLETSWRKILETRQVCRFGCWFELPKNSRMTMYTFQEREANGSIITSVLCDGIKVLIKGHWSKANNKVTYNPIIKVTLLVFPTPGFYWNMSAFKLYQLEGNSKSKVFILVRNNTTDISHWLPFHSVWVQKCTLNSINRKRHQP